ncbi:MAG: class I SAM-dependent methyltransferase [Pseudomonadota bacterium]
MSFSAKLISQLGNPAGLTGWLVLWRLNRANRGMNDLAYRALDLSENDRVLEIGFGGGALIDKIYKQNIVTFLAGIDTSALAVKFSKKRFQSAIRAGKIELFQGGEQSLPFDDATFSKVCCVNLIYFWNDVVGMMTEVARVLSCGGTFVVCYNEWAPDGKTQFSSQRVEDSLLAAGFITCTTEQGGDGHNDKYYCTVATLD